MVSVVVRLVVVVARLVVLVVVAVAVAPTLVVTPSPFTVPSITASPGTAAFLPHCAQPLEAAVAWPVATGVVPSLHEAGPMRLVVAPRGVGPAVWW